MTTLSKTIGLIVGSYPHHLDHLAPLCHLLGIPLVVTEPTLEKAARLFYPQVTLYCIDEPFVAEQVNSFADLIFSCFPQDFIDQIFFLVRQLKGHQPRSIWVPHGNSDKGHASYFMEGLAKETIAVVYGQKMIDFLIEKKVYANLYKALVVGNYRLSFYQKNRAFYDEIAHQKVLRFLPQNKQTILYAPTWNDAENSSSLASAWPYLVKNLPKNWSLVIKLHPNHLNDLSLISTLQEEVKKEPRIHLIETFPPVYPLLNAASIYLGDHSSIGYDFLSFRKPMFFLNQNERDALNDKGLFLFQCGNAIALKDYDVIYEVMQQSLASSVEKFRKKQEAVYSYAFGDGSHFEKNLYETCKHYETQAK